MNSDAVSETVGTVLCYIVSKCQKDPLGKFQISVICLEFMWYFFFFFFDGVCIEVHLNSSVKLPYFVFTKWYKMLEKYHRQFQTDDEKLEFAEGTFRPEQNITHVLTSASPPFLGPCRSQRYERGSFLFRNVIWISEFVLDYQDCSLIFLELNPKRIKLNS